MGEKTLTFEISALRDVTFPDDGRIPADYRGKKLEVFLYQGKCFVDQKELTGYAFEYAKARVMSGMY